MSATLDPRPIPAYAVPFWSDGQTIFAAIPGKAGGQPYITKHPFTESGFRAALKLLATRYSDAPPTQRYVSLRDFASRGAGTNAQQENARSVLKTLGIIR